LDHIRAYAIVTAQREPAPDREMPGIDRGLPRVQIPMILAEAAAEVAYRAHA
jgi:hypothetical protein